jgi:hypothetical protein
MRYGYTGKVVYPARTVGLPSVATLVLRRLEEAPESDGSSGSAAAVRPHKSLVPFAIAFSPSHKKAKKHEPIYPILLTKFILRVISLTPLTGLMTFIEDMCEFRTATQALNVQL